MLVYVGACSTYTYMYGYLQVYAWNIVASISTLYECKEIDAIDKPLYSSSMWLQQCMHKNCELNIHCNLVHSQNFNQHV